MSLRLLTVLILGCSALAAADLRDRILLKSGQPKLAIIDSERGNVLIIRATANSRPSEQRLGEVKSWTYREMEEGYWPQAVQARDQGRLAIAADMFSALATTGDREWMKVYGAYHEGVCWELLGDWTKAADAFGRAAAVEPAHRLAMDAQYRQGFALARDKKDAEATAIATALAEKAKAERIPGADARAKAIKAVLAYNAGDGEGLKKEGRAAIFGGDDAEAAVQFGTFFAEALRQLGKLREAKSEYERLLGLEGTDPANRVPLQLGLARTLLDDNDSAGALVILTGIDALPYGTIDQQCETRYLIGKIMAAELAKKKAENPAEGTDAYVALREYERNVRLFLQAAASSVSSSPAKASAQAELDALGPDPDVAAEEGAGAAEAKDTKAEAPTPKKPE